MTWIRGPLAVAIVALCLPGAAVAQQRTISVVGTASLSAANDAARVSFGVHATARSRSAALRGTSRRLRSVIAALRAQGVAPRDLRTGAVSTVRVTSRRGRVVRFAGRSGVRAVIRSAPRAGAAVGAVTNAGGFTSSGPDYFVFDGAALRRRALVAAFGDARAKAAALAAQAGLTLGAPITIRESGSVGFTRSQESRARPRSGETPVPTRPGTTKVAGAVDVVFAAG